MKQTSGHVLFAQTFGIVAQPDTELTIAIGLLKHRLFEREMVHQVLVVHARKTGGLRG